MMAGYNIQVKGLDTVLKKFEQYKDKTDAIDKELTQAAYNVETRAKQLAPRKNGKLAASIESNVTRQYVKTVSSSLSYAPFVEFGTGAFVFKGPYTFTASEQLYAKKFYVSGKGKTRSQAFLFPAFHQEIPKLMQRIKNVLFK